MRLLFAFFFSHLLFSLVIFLVLVGISFKIKKNSFCISFKYVLLLASEKSLNVSSVVGAPWRCGVLTTQGGG